MGFAQPWWVLRRQYIEPSPPLKHRIGDEKVLDLVRPLSDRFENGCDSRISIRRGGTHVFTPASISASSGGHRSL